MGKAASAFKAEGEGHGSARIVGAAGPNYPAC